MIEQVVNVCQTTIVQDAWARGQALTVHGWIYGLLDGCVRELGVNVDAAERLDAETCEDGARWNSPKARRSLP